MLSTDTAQSPSPRFHPSLQMAEIERLDLTMIKLKLQDAEDGPGWTAQECDEAEADYRRFLALKRAYIDRDIVPNRIVDAFWHQHILDTEKYAKDCDEVFGYFLHHFPYFGMRGGNDKANLVSAFEDTKQLFHRHFGQEYAAEMSKCRTACKPQKCK